MILALAAPLTALAQLSVQDPWARASAPGQGASAAYMKLSATAPVRVLGVRSPAAGKVELHETRSEGGVMKMLQVKAIEVRPGAGAELKPGGMHVMLMALKAPLKEGDSVPLTLDFEGADGKRGSLEVRAPVRPLAGGGGHHKH
jgi:copper(I)-binding protein